MSHMPISSQVSEDRRSQGVEDGWVCVGMFSGAHGVRGDVRLRSFTDDPKAIKNFDAIHKGANGPIVSFKVSKVIKGGFAAQVEGITNREDAQLLNGTQLFVPREAIGETADEDEYFLADLIGLEVVDRDANPVGHIKSVENYGSGDLLEIVMPKAVKGIGRFALVPFLKEWVPVVDIAAGRIVVAFDEWISTQVEVPTDASKEEAAEGKKGADLI